jgi:hypothetical protein
LKVAPERFFQKHQIFDLTDFDCAQALQMIGYKLAIEKHESANF